MPSGVSADHSPEYELVKALGYFENNAPRIRYKWFRSRGLFTGSGVVEAGCKTVIGQRLNLSGTKWWTTPSFLEAVTSGKVGIHAITEAAPR